MLALAAILLLGAAFRFFNVNWDKDTYHIHPDERHTTMVVTAIQWPSSLGQYFDTSHSPLNPRNVDMVYFYGTLPLFLTKYVGTVVDRAGYDQIHLVGRILSALFDLGSVLILFCLARRLFDWRVGLVASFLLALAVLNIQGAHYFTVDTFLTFFVLLTLWFTLDVAEGRGWPSFVALGVTMGLTLACKVSVFLLVAVVALGAWLRMRRQLADGRGPGYTLLRTTGGLLLAAAVALAIFRVAQPYAWAGPNYDGWATVPDPWGERMRFFERVPEPIRAVIMPNPQWVADIVSAGAQQTGEADLPWGRQWTERTPWLYPLENMILWGLGVPLGIAAWLGVALTVLQLVRAWRNRGIKEGKAPEYLKHWDLLLIPLAWVLLTFLWQGMQFVKSIRYFLPIYPFLAMFAGHLVVSAWDWAKAVPKGQPGGKRRVAQFVASVLAASVLLGTLAWAWAFIQIYREPITRVQASRWMYQEIEPGATIANEHFDDPLPFNLDGHIAFGSGQYQGVDLKLYDEDTPEKLDELLDVLDEADYISMSSGRLFTSIPRLPMRYPVTTRYYELLFAEKLGFEKAAEFHSYPRLFGLEFRDDRAEEQFTVYDHPKVLIYRKTDGYDRERVRAQLTEGINWEQIPHWLNPRDVPRWKRTHQRQHDLMLTREQQQVQARGGTWASLFDRNSLANRRPTLVWLILVGGLGVLAMPLTALVLGRLPDRGYILARPVGALMVAWISWILTNLTPLGYTRTTILLALAIVAGLSLASLLIPGHRRRISRFLRTRYGLIFANEILFLAFFALFWLIRWSNPDLWHAWKGGEKPMDFAYLNAVIKSTEFPPYDPWFAGGYLNYYYFGQVMVGTLIKLAGIMPAVAYNLVLATWFAMTAMGAFCVTYNVIAGGADRAGGTIPTPGGSRADASGTVRETSLGPIRPLFFGLVGALFVTVLGNLGQVHLLLLKLGEGVLNSFQSTIPGLAGLVRAVVGSFEVLFGGKALPISIDEWYWNASRAIPSGPYESVITEFPFFTFLYADLHAHLIAFPLSLISLAIAVAVVQRPHGAGMRGWPGFVRRLPPLLLWALTIGALRTTNTWDVPPHLLVVLGALIIAEFSGQNAGGMPSLPGAQRQVPFLRPLGTVVWEFGLVFVLSWSVLYRPFWASYGSFYNSIALWTGTRTALWAYLVVHGLFLFVIVSYLCARVIGDWRHEPLLRRIYLTFRYRKDRRRLNEAARLVGVSGLPVSRWIWLALGFLILLELFFVIPGLASFTQPKPDAIEVGGYAYRGLAVLALGLPISVLGLLLLVRPGLTVTERLWAYWVLLGLAMTLGVEVIVIQGDIGRMNTVFKFYLQVWLMWGVGAAAALAWMVRRLRGWEQGRGLWLGVLAVLLFCAALYPPLAVAAKIQDRFETELGPSLDGWAYMQTALYMDPNGPQYELKWDLQAIQWLLDNVVGTPTLIEGHTPEYRWGGRYSINTGLPTVLGWNWHQRQQRAAAGEQVVWDRADDVTEFYNTPLTATAESLLRKYDVRYVVLGPLERAYYTPVGLAKFESMVKEGTLQPVFQNEQVTIYEVAR